MSQLSACKGYRAFIVTSKVAESETVVSFYLHPEDGGARPTATADGGGGESKFSGRKPARAPPSGAVAAGAAEDLERATSPSHAVLRGGDSALGSLDAGAPKAGAPAPPAAQTRGGPSVLSTLPPSAAAAAGLGGAIDGAILGPIFGALGCVERIPTCLLYTSPSPRD